MMNLCLPSTIWGPFCSVPAVATMTVVVPPSILSRTSVQVSSSSQIVSGAWATAEPVTVSVRARSVSSVRVCMRALISSTVACVVVFLVIVAPTEASR